MTLEQQKLANQMIKTFITLPKHSVNNEDGSVSYTVKLDEVMTAWSTFARAVEQTTPYEKANTDA